MPATTLTKKEARRLAAHIPKEAFHQVRTSVGQTNGRYCIHVTDTQADDRREASTTLYSLGEWLAHPLHKINRASGREDWPELTITKVGERNQ